MIYKIEPYYELHINDDGVRVISNSLRKKGAELSQYLNPYGYLRVKMGQKHKLIHQLIAETILGPRPEGLVINHKDGDKLNNHPDNLEYCTIAENIAHSIEHGMHVANDPERNGRYKDGRCKDLNAYKLVWYHQNKKRLKEEKKGCYRYLRGEDNE